MKRFFFHVPTMTAALFLIAPLASAAAPSAAERTLLDHLLTALQNGDYPTFAADGDKNFKHLDKARFNTVSVQIGPKLKNGYSLSLRSEADEDGAHVTRWEIKFNDASPTDLATLAVSNNEVAGFLVNPLHGHAGP